MATLPGEAASDPRLVDSYVEAGMDCARINCAHDSPLVWRAMAGQVRRAAERHGRTCRILMDLPGPKCRIESLSPQRPGRIQVGDRLRLAQRLTSATPADLPVVAVTLPQIVAGLPVGAPVWIDDGKIRGRVAAIEGGDRIVEIVGARPKGGKLRIGKGIDFPGARLDLPPETSTQVVTLQKDILQRATSAQAMRDLTPDQRAAQLVVLNQEATAKLTQTLGARGFDAYKATGGGYWLQMLQPRPTPSSR